MGRREVFCDAPAAELNDVSAALLAVPPRNPTRFRARQRVEHNDHCRGRGRRGRPRGEATDPSVLLLHNAENSWVSQCRLSSAPAGSLLLPNIDPALLSTWW